MHSQHHCISITDAIGESGVNVGGFNAAYPRPLCNGVGFVANRDAPITAFVVSLLYGCGPTAVIKTVAEAVVFAIKRHALRAWAHVVSKVCKALAPAVAHSDTTTAIKAEHIIFFNVAPRNHVFPSLAFAVHVCSAVGVAVGHARCTLLSQYKAPAGCDIAALCFRSNSLTLPATVAVEKPYFQTLLIAANRLYSGKFSKNLTKNIGMFVHGVHCTTTRLTKQRHALRTGSYRHMKNLLKELA